MNNKEEEGNESENRKVGIRLHGKKNSELSWRKAGQPSHLVAVVDWDQYVVK